MLEVDRGQFGLDDPGFVLWRGGSEIVGDMHVKSITGSSIMFLTQTAGSTSRIEVSRYKSRQVAI